MLLHNPLADPFFMPSVKIVGGLFVVGFGLVLFFARHDLKAGLTGELGKRFIGWMIIAPLFLVATFVGGLLGALARGLDLRRCLLSKSSGSTGQVLTVVHQADRLGIQGLAMNRLLEPYGPYRPWRRLA